MFLYIKPSQKENMSCQVKHWFYINDMKVETVKVKYEPKIQVKPLQVKVWTRWLTLFVKKVTVEPELIVWEEAFPWP